MSKSQGLKSKKLIFKEKSKISSPKSIPKRLTKLTKKSSRKDSINLKN